MARQLVVCVHWTDEPNLEAVAAAFAPLKAPGTVGHAVLYEAGDPFAVKMYDLVAALPSSDVGVVGADG